eukprot:364435-Chlamydomonas_euryale.AAC.11
MPQPLPNPAPQVDTSTAPRHRSRRRDARQYRGVHRLRTHRGPSSPLLHEHSEASRETAALAHRRPRASATQKGRRRGGGRTLFVFGDRPASCHLGRQHGRSVKSNHGDAESLFEKERVEEVGPARQSVRRGLRPGAPPRAGRAPAAHLPLHPPRARCGVLGVRRARRAADTPIPRTCRNRGSRRSPATAAHGHGRSRRRAISGGAGHAAAHATWSTLRRRQHSRRRHRPAPCSISSKGSSLQRSTMSSCCGRHSWWPAELPGRLPGAHGGCCMGVSHGVCRMACVA